MRRTPLVLLSVTLCCTAAPVFAQAITNAGPPEPALSPGTTAFRIANESDCPVLVRARTNGALVSQGAILPHSIGWFHASAVDVIHEIEVIVSPRACGMTFKQGAPTTPPAPPPGPPASGVGFRRGSVFSPRQPRLAMAVKQAGRPIPP